MMKNLQWTDLELLDRGIESYPELVITDEVMMDMLPNGSLTGIGVKQKEEVGTTPRKQQWDGHNSLWLAVRGKTISFRKELQYVYLPYLQKCFCY